MKLLLDTHFFLSLVLDVSRISEAERQLLDRNEGRILVSAVSIRELRLKWHAVDREGRRKGLMSPEVAVQIIDDSTMTLVPLSGEQCATALEPALPHKDPFDEMLLVHAQQLGARLLTRDRLLVDHPLAWRA